MGFIPTITCRKCRRQYSGLLKKCPHCGTRRQSVSTRTAATTDSAQKATAAAARAAENSRWQLIFGLILISAVILSVIVLITTGLQGREADKNNPDGAGMISPPPSMEPIASPPPSATPPAEPEIAPTSIKIYYLTSPVVNGFTHTAGRELQLNASVYPLTTTATVKWESSDTSIFTVDQTGLVKGVSPGSATLTASCGDIKDVLNVIIKAA